MCDRRGLEHCAQCDQYICEKLNERIVTFADVQNRIGTYIPFPDYVRFIQPYENKLRLETLDHRPRLFRQISNLICRSMWLELR